MSFGLSPNKTYTEMVGADVAVAWVDKQTGKGHSYDYYLDDRSQCSGKHGSCPDSNLEVKLINLEKSFRFLKFIKFKLLILLDFSRIQILYVY